MKRRWFALIVLLCLAFPILTQQIVKAESNPQTASLETITTITLAKIPYSIEVNEETNRVYASVEEGLVVIDGTNKQILTTINLAGYNPSSITVDSKNNQIFVRVYTNMSLYIVIDGATNSILKMESTENVVEEIVLDKERDLIYVPHSEYIYNNKPDGVNVFDSQTLQFKYLIPIPGSESRNHHSVSIAVDTELNRIYATWSGDDQLYLFDGSTRELIKKENFSSLGNTIDGFNQWTKRLYIGGDGDNKVIDGITLKEVSPNYFGSVDASDFRCNIIYGYLWWSSSTQLTDEFFIADASSNEIIATLKPYEGTLDWSLHWAINTKTGEIYSISKPREILVVQGPSSTRPLLVTNLSITPPSVQIEKPVAISYNIRNLANNSIAYTPTIKVGNTQITQNQVQIQSSEVRTFTFTTNTTAVGNYAISAEGLSANLTVNTSPISLISPSPSPSITPSPTPTIPEVPQTIMLLVTAAMFLIVTVGLVSYRRRSSQNLAIFR